MKNFLATLVGFMLMTQSAFAYSFVFGDVQEDNVFIFSIEYLAENGVVDGYPDGDFKPWNKINRAEMLKILIEGQMLTWELDELDDPLMPFMYDDNECFDDVPAGQWYTGYVCYAKDLGIVEGYEGNLFKPDQNVTFVEAMKMTLETFNYSYEEMDLWYEGIVTKAALYNFNPLNITSFDQEIDRAQMSDIIARVLNYEDDSLEDFLGSAYNIYQTYNTIYNGTSQIVEYHLMVQEKFKKLKTKPTSLYHHDEYEFTLWTNAYCAPHLEIKEIETPSYEGDLAIENYGLFPVGDQWTSEWLYYGIIATEDFDAFAEDNTFSTVRELLTIDDGDKIVFSNIAFQDAPVTMPDHCIDHEVVQASGVAHLD